MYYRAPARAPLTFLSTLLSAIPTTTSFSVSKPLFFSPTGRCRRLLRHPLRWSLQLEWSLPLECSLPLKRSLPLKSLLPLRAQLSWASPSHVTGEYLLRLSPPPKGSSRIGRVSLFNRCTKALTFQCNMVDTAVTHRTLVALHPRHRHVVVF